MNPFDPSNPWLSASPFYSKKRVSELKDYEQRMMLHDDWLKERLAEQRGQGIKTFEYGQLVHLLESIDNAKSFALLDVGPGNSTFPAYLATLTQKVATLDLPTRLESLTSASKAILDVRHVENHTGDMTDIPFPDGHFDIVTSISAIEHLDDPGPGPDGQRFQIPRATFIANTRKALVEMVRVLRPCGYLYLTTDAYLPDRQKDCAWSRKRGDELIWSAYHYSDLQDVFLNTLEQESCAYDPRLTVTPDFLLGSEDFATYRGRFFVTFCVLARKDL